MTTSAYPQTEFARISKASLLGCLWEEDLMGATPLNGLLPNVDEVAFTKTIEIGANNPGDEVGVSIAGGEVLVVSGANATATALLLANALTASVFAATYVDTSIPAAAVVTIVGVVGQDPVITGIAKGTTTSTIAIAEAAVVQPVAGFGEGVVVYDAGGGLNDEKFRRPSSMTDRFLGVVSRTPGSSLPLGQRSQAGLSIDPDECTPGSYALERTNVGIMVPYIGTAPNPLLPVYHIMTGLNAGAWAAVSGAVRKVVTLTSVSVADGSIGFSLAGLSELSLTATANATNDMTSLVGQFNASGDYRALVADYTVDVVDNLDGTATITFAEGVDPAFVDTSTGTSTVSQNVDTSFVAANAVLHPEFSWGKASIEASADAPARAFLRLSRA
jgi:hypothetical protein